MERTQKNKKYYVENPIGYWGGKMCRLLRIDEKCVHLSDTDFKR